MGLRSLPVSCLAWGDPVLESTGSMSEWVKLLSCVWLFATPWAVDYQASPSMGFSRQGSGMAWHFLLQGYLPHPGIEPRSSQADASPSEPPGKPTGSALGLLAPPRRLPPSRDASPRTATASAPSLAGPCQPAPLQGTCSTHWRSGSVSCGSVFLSPGF